MTPYEKAKELFNKFDQNVVSTNYRHMSKDSVKQCAIIAIDEILFLLKILERNNSYYLEVKQEIEKL